MIEYEKYKFCCVSDMILTLCKSEKTAMMIFKKIYNSRNRKSIRRRIK